jgi:hypothetical protein
MNLKTSILLITLLSPVALAHDMVMSKSGTIGGLMHIEPNDDLMVGMKQTLWFDVTQKGGKKLSLEGCVCTLKVYAGSYKTGAKPVLQPQLELGKEGEALGKTSATLQMNKEGPYTVRLEGKPKTGSSFAAFALMWVVRADKM